MKTLISFFTAAFLLLSATAFAQQTLFENAALAKAGDGLPCVQLDWKKGAENTAFYLVERRSNGVDFKQIALVFTAEDPGFSAYQFRDKTFAQAGRTAYYRIALVNGKKELTYLPVRKVETSAANVAVLASVAADALAGSR